MWEWTASFMVEGVKQDYNEAMKWYLEGAISRIICSSMLLWGGFIYNGFGVG